MVAVVTGTGLGLERSSAWVLGSRGQLGSAAMGRAGDNIYVNGATGNLVIQNTDEILIGRGTDDVIGRAYNSLGTLTDDNGDNWRPTTARQVQGLTGTVNTAGSTVMRVDWDGSEVVFTYDTVRAAYVSKEGSGAYDTIQYNGSVWSWTDGNSRVTEVYGASNRISSSTDADGNVLTFTYTGSLLTRVTTASGDYTNLTWSGNNLTQIATVTSGAANTLTRVRYAYDASNRLSTVTVDLSPTDNVIADGKTYVTTYTYDGTSRRVASIAQTDGSLLQIAYVLVGSDYRVQTLTQTAASGDIRATSFSYNTTTRTTTITDALGNVTSLTYDTAGQLVKLVSPPAVSGGNSQIAEFIYEADGDLSTISYFDGTANYTANTPFKREYLLYDTNGNRVSERNNHGITVTRTFGTKNELLTESSYVDLDPDGSGAGLPTSSLTTRYAYDAENHLRFVVNSEGEVTEYQYAAVGPLLSTIEYAANAYNISGLAATTSISEATLVAWVNGIADKSTVRRTDTTYDYRDNIATVTSYSLANASGVGLATSDYSRTTYTYDQFGKLLNRQTNASAASEVFVYDGLGRLISSTDMASATTNIAFNDATGTTVVTLANGTTQTSVYNRAGEKVAYTESNIGLLPSTFDKGLKDFTSSYGVYAGTPGVGLDAGGFTLEDVPNIGKVAQRAGGQGFAGTQSVITTQAGKTYRLTTRVRITANAPDMSDSKAFLSIIGFNSANAYFWASNTPQQITAADGWMTISTVVSGDILLAQGIVAFRAMVAVNRTSAGASLTSTSQIQFIKVEDAGVQSASASSTTGYLYDKLGQLRIASDPTGRKTHYLYDNVGRKVADITADGALTEYRYDAADRLVTTIGYMTKLTAVQLTSLVDASGSPANPSMGSIRPATSVGDVWEWRVYDPADRLIETVDGMGSATVYSYDGASKLVSTTSYANAIAAGTIAGWKTSESGNLWANADNGSLWPYYGASMAAAGTIDGANAFLLTVLQNGTVGAAANLAAVSAGDTVTYAVSVKAVGSATSHFIGLYGASTLWGANSNSSARIVSGPGTLTQSTGGIWAVTGLSTTQATRIEITRNYIQAENIYAYFYVHYANSQAVAGDQVILAAPQVTKLSAAAGPTALVLPTANATTDRLTRNFYDNDGRVIGILDGAGGLSQIFYDEAGQKIRQIGYATATTAGLRASGTFAQLLASVGTSASDVRTDYIYDGRGLLRFTLDANARPIEYVYDANGSVLHTTDYAGSIASASSYSLAYVQAQLTSTGLATNANNRIGRLVYDAAGRLAFGIDAVGGVAAYAYDSVGNATKQMRYASLYTIAGDQALSAMQSWATSHAADAGNRISRTLYDALGRTAYEVDPEGFVTEHQYDAAGRVIKDIRYAAAYTVTDTTTQAQLATAIGTLPATAVVTSYAYDGAGRLTDVTDGVGVITHYVFDALGQATDTTIAYGTSDAATTHRLFDAAGRIVSETRAYGASEASTTTYAYDALSNLLTVTDGKSNASGGSYLTTRSYDALGRVVTVTVPLDASTNAITTNQYDMFGNLVKVTDPRGNASYFYYDKLNRLKLQIDPEGYATETSYTIGGEVATAKRYAVKASNIGSVTVVPTLTTHAKDALTTFGRDKLGRVTSVTDAENYVEGYGLNAFGDRISVTNKLNGQTFNLFDKRGLLIQETLPVGSVLANGDQQSSTIVNKFEYDARGNRTKMIEAFGLIERRTTIYAYDKMDRLIYTMGDRITVVGQNGMLIPGDIAPTENFVYDKRGNLIAHSDANGALTLSYYDDLNRRIAEVSPVGTLSTWAYDANGNIASARVYGDALSLLPTDPNSPAAQVYRMYDLILGRMPNPAEVIAWVNYMAYTSVGYVPPAGEPWPAIDPYGERINALEGAFAFIMNDAGYLERFNNPPDNVNFITKLYQFALRRDPATNPDEVAIWQGAMAGGWTRAGMLTVFSELIDHRGWTAPLIAQTAAGGTPPAPINASNYRETTFSYDRNNRLTTTTIANVRTGFFNGTAYQTQIQNVSSSNVFDVAGNIIQQTDARGFKTFNYYDKNGRRIAQADPNNYLTVWSYNGDGNVESEIRYANLFGITPTTTTTVAALQASVSTQSHDRTTIFTYDRNGRRLTESRTGVTAWTVNGTNGVLGGASTTATITYTYNGLGEVTSKTEANGEVNQWTYDAIGRQTAQLSPYYWDFEGVTALNTDGHRLTTVRNYYNGINNITRSTMGDLADPGAPRVTTYTYGVGGRLWLLTNPDGYQTEHYYDAAGHLVSQCYYRPTSTSGVSDIQSYRYDAAGRLISKTDGRWNGSSWDLTGYVNQTRYNAYGEVSAQGMNGYQETFDYDNTGRLWRTNSGDGKPKFYIYDQNGNRTLAISSTGADLSSWGTIDAAIAAMSNNGAAPIGNLNASGAVATIMTYDGRNGLLSVREPFRENGVSTPNVIVRGKDYNAFEEVVSEYDARGNAGSYRTWYDYNTMGRLVSKQMPQISVTAENGAASSVTPTEYYYNDVSGRLVGVRDANNNLTTRTLLAGTGLDGAEVKVLKEFHPDGGVLETKYDVFGDARVIINEIGKVETRAYDGMGRLIQITRPARTDGSGIQLTDYYVYDSLGRRIRHWNSALGDTVKDLTDYDIQGRVISQVDMGGNTTTYSYVWLPNAVTTGLAAGGWMKTTTMSGAPASAWEITDVFGHIIDSQDFGGHNSDYTYNNAGWLTQLINGSGLNTAYAYYNTGRISSVVTGTDNGYSGETATSTYKYDIDGNRTFEGHYITGHDYDYYSGATQYYTLSHQLATVTWNALNRMISFSDTGASGSTPVSIAYEYDAVGNVRHMLSSYRILDGQGVAASTPTTQDYWYKYDAMNRFVTTKGVFTGTSGSGVISRGLTGSDISYNAAGQRATATRTIQKSMYMGSGLSDIPYTADQREEYSYTADGYLEKVKIAEGDDATIDWNTMNAAAPATATQRAVYSRDAMGRVTNLAEYDAAGTMQLYNRAVTYNAKSEVTQDVVTTQRYESGWKTYVATTSYDYNLESSAGVWNGAYQGGALIHSRTVTTKNGAANATADTRNTLVWWGGAQQASANVITDNASGADTNYTSTYYHDDAGHLTSVYIADGRPRTVSFINDANGLILQRDEKDNYGNGDPRELHYYFDGTRVGDISNNGTSDTDYANSIAARMATGGAWAFQGGSDTANPYADFDQSYDPINGFSSEGTGSRYTVAEGDTLFSIAQQVWGDSALWYLIADANGFDGTETLIAGSDLAIPNKVANVHNNSSTFKVYDPNKAIGDLSPNAPKPPKKGGCGAFGQILTFVVAAVVAYFAPPLFASLGPVLGGAATGVAASLASQGFAVATGIQDQFNWKSVGLSAISGGVGGGGGFASFGKVAGSAFLGNVLGGVVGNALTQGIAIAAGLQKKFDWAGVAAGGIVAGVGGSIKLAGAGGRIVSGMAGGIAGAAARSIVTGTSFGDNLEAVLPSVIGNTIGNLAASKIATLGSLKLSYDPSVFGGNGSVSGGGTVQAFQGTGSPAANDATQRTVAAVVNGGAGSEAGYDGPEIVVTASREDRYAQSLISNSQFAAIEATARKYGWDARRENAEVRAVASQQIRMSVGRASGSVTGSGGKPGGFYGDYGLGLGVAFNLHVDREGITGSVGLGLYGRLIVGHAADYESLVDARKQNRIFVEGTVAAPYVGEVGAGTQLSYRDQSVTANVSAGPIGLGSSYNYGTGAIEYPQIYLSKDNVSANSGFKTQEIGLDAGLGWLYQGKTRVWQGR